MTLDLNDADPLRSFDLIPIGTIVTAQMTIRPGGAGEDGWLKHSADGGCEGLDLEFTVVDGEYAKKKFWQFAILTGSTTGHATAAEITRSFLRGVLESARGVKANDVSPAAYAKRKAEVADFNGLRFIGRIYVEKSKDPNYPDKNKIEPLPADHKAWKSIEQLPPSPQGSPGATGAAAGAAQPAQAITRPEWAS